MDRQYSNNKKKYVVSSLTRDGTVQQPITHPRVMTLNSKSKPELMQRSQDIFIPSVSLVMDGGTDYDSPRSLGSNSTLQSGDGMPPYTNARDADLVAKKESTVNLSAFDSVAGTKSVLGLRQKVPHHEIAELRKRLAIGASPTYNDGALSPMNDDVSIASNMDEPKHFSSGVSVQLFPNRKENRGKSLWNTNSHGTLTTGLWGNEVLADRPGSTMEAREVFLEQEKKRKEIEALTFALREGDITSVNEMDGKRIGPFGTADDDAGDDDLSLDGHGLVDAYVTAFSTSFDEEKEQQVQQQRSSQLLPTEHGSNEAAQEHKQEQMGLGIDMHAEEGATVSDFIEKHNDSEALHLVNTDALQSRTRQNLMELGRYVHGHTNRKIMIAWTVIESRFQKSITKKMEMVRDENGLTHPQKRSALYLSALTGVLCSPGIRCTYKELPILYSNFNCSASDVFKSRQLAAIKAVLGPTNGQGLRQKDELLADMNRLMVDEEPLISLEQLLTAVFPADPVERKKELDSLEAEKSIYIQQMMDEKNKREATAKAIETRKAKMLDDFDESVRELQFAKGPLTFNKLKTMKDLIDYCRVSYEKAHAEIDVKVSDELVSLLGVDAFPDCVRRSIAEAQAQMRAENAKYAYKPGQEKPNFNKPPAKFEPIKIGKAPELTAQQKEDLAKAQRRVRIGYEGQFRLPIHNPISGCKMSLIPLIREVVSYGKGLSGLAYRDVVEIMQAYASTRLQARFRCHKRYWRYKAARRKWTVLFRNVKRTFFKSWSIFIRHVYDTRDFCWRKLIAWHVYTVNAKKRREHFRINFWPFYVWHRYAVASRNAKEKAKFLVHRVEPTLRTLRVYRAWKNYYMEEKKKRNAADGFKDMVLRYRGRISLAWLRRWTRRRVRIRKSWYKHGMVTYKHKLFICKLTPFLIWKMVWYYKKLLHSRLVQFSPTFRSHIMQQRPVKIMPPLGHIKALAKEAYLASGGDAQREADRKAAKKKQKKAAKLGRGSESDAGDERSLASSTTASRRIRPFLYKKGPKYCGTDMDSDGEEIECTPQRMKDIYQNQIPEIQSPSELEFLSEADDFIFGKILALAQRYRVVDNWNLCEWCMRYHIRMHRAFKNLRTFAKVSRNAKKSQHLHNKKIKIKTFNALISWMMRDPATINFNEQTDAERIHTDAKVYRMDKMMKWRGVAAEIKKVYGRDEDDDDVDDGANDIGSPSKAAIYARKQRRAEREAKKKADLEAGIAPFVPPNFLDWDRQDREIEMKQAELMLKISKKVREQAHKMSTTADKESEIFEKGEALLDMSVAAVFEQENSDSKKAIANEMEYVSKFKIHAADVLITVLGKIYKEVQAFLLKSETKRYFRAIRMPMITQRSHAMFNRKKMVNWIRICRRLASLYKNAPVYYVKRKSWIVFNRWLKLVEKESLDTSPGHVQFIRRQMEFYSKFSNRLKTNGLVKTVYPNPKKLLSVAADTESIFCRWLMAVTEDKLFRIMEDLAYKAYSLKLLQKVFWSLRTLMTPTETVDFRAENVPFLLVRAKCDLDQLSKRFVAKRRKNFQVVICNWNRRYAYFSMREAKKAISFKNFLAHYRVSVNRRLIREQRILVDSFDLRGTQQYIDICCPEKDSSIMPRMMARLEGKVFHDPHPLTTEQYSSLTPVLPGGFRLMKIRVCHQDINGTVEASITGWQCVWGADGVADVEGQKRGKWKGAAMTTIEFVVPKDDFVMGVEYVYDGPSILGIRFRCFFSGYSRWLGARPSVTAPLTVTLGCELAPHQSFEDDYWSPGRDETENPSMPRSFVIGFTGLDFNFKATALGLIVRKVKDQHIFSYTWVGDALNKLNAKNNGSANCVAGSEKGGKRNDKVADEASVDIKSMPSQIDTGKYLFTLDAPSVNEEITLASAQMFPPVTGAKNDKSALNKGENSLDDASSLGPGSVSFAEQNDETGLDEENADDAQADPSAPDAVPSLSSVEEQFFDILRMRNMEVITAQKRAEAFARRMWTARHLRKDPLLNKLTTVKIIAPLTTWYFQAICKRLVRATTTETEGENLLECARLKRLQVDKLTRRSVSEFLRRDEYVNNQKLQSWFSLQILSPALRQQKKVYLDTIKTLTYDAQESREKANTLLLEAIEDQKRGKMLLPRMQLSEFVSRNIRLKLAAARHKETLLERMDMDAIKRALSGGDAVVSELSDVSMEIIRSTLAAAKPDGPEPFTLDKVIEMEMAKVKEKKKLALQVPTSRGFAAQASASEAKRTHLNSREKRREKSSAQGEEEPMYQKSHDAYREALGQRSFRKSLAINPLNTKSLANFELKLGAVVGERTIMSSSSAAYLKNNKSQKDPSDPAAKSQAKLVKRLLSKSLEVGAAVNANLESKSSASTALADRILALQEFSLTSNL